MIDAARTPLAWPDSDPRTCPLCGEWSKIPDPPEPLVTRNLREEPACSHCRATYRHLALATCLVAPYRHLGCESLRDATPELARLRIHEFSMRSVVHRILSPLAGFSWSEYFEDVPRGTVASEAYLIRRGVTSFPRGGVRCEDIQRLTFTDETFDLIISQDVLEHIPNPGLAAREVLRVLRPGGRHVFTTPFNPNLATSRIRARQAADGTIEHLLPPEYHGDPFRRGGALVFTEFGADLVDLMRDTGFSVVLHERNDASVRGGYLVVFEAFRPDVR